MSLWRSVTGLLFLSLRQAELASNLRQGFSPQSQAELEPALKPIWLQGYSRTSAFIRGSIGVAAPVFGFDTSLALFTLGHSVRFKAEEATIRAALLRAAQGCEYSVFRFSC